MELPRRDVREVLVVAQSLAVGGLALFPEMPSTRFGAMQGVERQHLGKLEIIGHPAGVLEVLVQVVGRARYRDVLPELVAQLGNPLERAPESGVVAGHARLVTQKRAEIAAYIDRKGAT